MDDFEDCRNCGHKIARHEGVWWHIRPATSIPGRVTITRMGCRAAARSRGEESTMHKRFMAWPGD